MNKTTVLGENVHGEDQQDEAEVEEIVLSPNTAGVQMAMGLEIK